MLAIRLPQPIEDRLNALAEETGRTKTTLAREAILEFIDFFGGKFMLKETKYGHTA